MNSNRIVFFGCSSCSTFFTDRTQHLANCVDERNPFHVTGRLLKTANVYERGESAEDTIMGRFSIDGVEEGSVGIELTVVNCAGCLSECGWKITEVNPHRLFREGQYLLNASEFFESVRTW